MTGGAVPSTQLSSVNPRRPMSIVTILIIIILVLLALYLARRVF